MHVTVLRSIASSTSINRAWRSGCSRWSSEAGAEVGEEEADAASKAAVTLLHTAATHLIKRRDFTPHQQRSYGTRVSPLIELLQAPSIDGGLFERGPLPNEGQTISHTVKQQQQLQGMSISAVTHRKTATFARTWASSLAPELRNATKSFRQVSIAANCSSSACTGA